MIRGFLKKNEGWMFTALLVFLVALLGLSYGRAKLDDAYIYYRYVDNLTHGDGFVYNVGERVNACTSFLYPLVVAFISVMLSWIPGLEIPIVGNLVCFVSLCFVVLAGMRVFREAGLRKASLCFPLLLLANPLLRHAIGMETFLTMALIMWSFLMYARGRYVLSSALCGLAVLARPDSMILAGVLFLDYVLSKRKLPTIPVMAVFLSLTGSWLLFNGLYFGEVLPMTLSAKLAQVEGGQAGSGLVFMKGLAGSIWFYNPFFKYTFITGLAASVLYMIIADRAWMRCRTLVLIFSWSILYLVVYGFVLNAPPYWWYYTPLAIGVSLCFALLIELVYRRRLVQNLISESVYLFLLIVCASIVVLSLAAKSSLSRLAPRYQAYTMAAEWFDKNAPKESSVAANEIGILGYQYKQGRIIDALGLVTPGVSEHVARREYDWYVEAYKPDYLMFNHPHRPVLEAMVHEAWFKKQYEIKKVIGAGATSVALYGKK